MENLHDTEEEADAGQTQLPASVHLLELPVSHLVGPFLSTGRSRRGGLQVMTTLLMLEEIKTSRLCSRGRNAS